MKILHDQDADAAMLSGKTVAVIGYGNQGAAQALCMRDSGVKVIIGSIKDASYDKAIQDGFEVLPIAEAAARADIVHMLLPDEFHGPVYAKDIAPHMKAGKVLSCSHGFNIIYKQIVPPADVDVIMVAPKSPASEERKAFLQGFGVPGLISVRQNASGKARDIALAMAKTMGFTRAGCLECTFEEETHEDLFGEQVVLCGGCVELMKAGFEVLVEKGYPPEMAYFEVLHELKLIVDLIFEGGIQKMNAIISNTAEWGEYSVGPKIIDAGVKQRMREALQAIEDGSFAKEWLAEARNGAPNLLAKRKALGNHPIEIVGREIRALFEQKLQK
jgi:ketol-acid reductoisomerase